jgi:WD40 repeat protein
MTIGSKERYLARGDSVAPGNGPREDVFGSTQLMSAGRFNQSQAAIASLSRFAATAWFNGGQTTEDRQGAIFTPIKVSPGIGSSFTITTSEDGGLEYDVNEYNITGFCTPRTGTGTRLIATNAFDWMFPVDNISTENIPFEDDPAKNYNIAIACSVVPARSEQNTRTGVYEWVEELAVMGISAVPETVTYDAILDQITLNFGIPIVLNILSGEGAQADSLAGRTAIAWKVAPLGDTSVSILSAIIAYTGTQNKIVLNGSFGQDPSGVSLVPEDYALAMLGPAVYSSTAFVRADLPGVAHLAYGRISSGGSFDHDAQTRIPHMYHLSQTIFQMTDPELSPNKSSIPRLSVGSLTHEPIGTPLFTVYNNARTGNDIAFQVKKGGALFGAISAQSTLAGFIEGSSGGELALIDGTDYSKRPFDLIDSEIAVELTCYGLHSDGRFLFTIEGDSTLPTGTIRVYDCEDLAGGFIAELAGIHIVTGASGDPLFDAFSSDGSYIALAINDSGNAARAVKAFKWDSLTLTITHEWTYTPAVNVKMNDVVCSNGAVYIAQDDSGATASMVRMPYDAGTGGAAVTVADADWTEVYSGAGINPNSVAAGGGYVIFGGEDTGVSNGQQVRVYLDSATKTLKSSQHLGSTFDMHPRMLACDGISIFSLDSAGKLRKNPVNPAVNTLHDEIAALSTITTGHMCMDQKWVYLLDSSPTGLIFVVDKNYQTGGSGWTHKVNKTELGVTDIFDVCSDGVRVFAGSFDAADSIASLMRPGQSPTVFRRNVAEDMATPYKWLAQPMES